MTSHFYTTSTKDPAPLRIGPVVPQAVHDGDSFWIAVPLHGLWPGIKEYEDYTRVAHCNAAELKTPLGVAARDAVDAWLRSSDRGQMMAHGWGRDNFGRWLMDLEDATGAFLSDYVLSLPGSVRMNVHEQLRGEH